MGGNYNIPLFFKQILGVNISPKHVSMSYKTDLQVHKNRPKDEKIGAVIITPSGVGKLKKNEGRNGKY